MLSQKNKKPKDTRKNEAPNQRFGHIYSTLFKREAKPSSVYNYKMLLPLH